jgi:hypothetical protein
VISGEAGKVRPELSSEAQWFALTISFLGMLPIRWLGSLMTGVAVGSSVIEFFHQLEQALGDMQVAGDLTSAVRHQGGMIYAGDNFGRLKGDLLDLVLENNPHLRGEIGNSTEADIRAKILNAVLKNIDEGKKPVEVVHTKTGKRLPDLRDKIVALESLDADSRRNFDGRNASNLFKAKGEVSKMPRKFTYVIALGDPPSGHSGYERVIAYSEQRLTVRQSLRQLLGSSKTRRPDYVTVRYQIAASELNAITQGHGIEPRYREILEAASGKKSDSQIWNKGRKVKCLNPMIKSIDFNTLITGETALNHVKKHGDTLTKLTSSLYQDGMELTGKVGVLLREWYHQSPSVFKREGSATYGLLAKMSHTIQLSFEVARNGKIGKWVVVRSTTGNEKFVDEFTRQASKLRRQLRKVIHSVGRRR